MAFPKIEGRVTVPSGGWSISVSETGPSVGPVTITLAAGDYYLTSTTALLSTLATAMTANGTLNGTYSGSLDDTSDDSATGKVTLSATGITTFAITWSSTALRDFLGFTGNVSGALTYTGTEQSEYLWLPNVGRTNPLSPDPPTTGYDLGLPETDFTMALAPSGHSRRLKYNTRYRETFEFLHVRGNKTRKALETIQNESFEKFYEDVISAGRPIRYYPSRADDSVYWTQFIADAEEMRALPVIPNWVGASSLFHIRHLMRKLV